MNAEECAYQAWAAVNAEEFAYRVSAAGRPRGVLLLRGVGFAVPRRCSAVVNAEECARQALAVGGRAGALVEYVGSVATPSFEQRRVSTRRWPFVAAPGPWRYRGKSVSTISSGNSGLYFEWDIASMCVESRRVVTGLVSWPWERTLGPASVLTRSVLDGRGRVRRHGSAALWGG